MHVDVLGVAVKGIDDRIFGEVFGLVFVDHRDCFLVGDVFVE